MIWPSPARTVVLDVHDFEGILDSIDALAAVVGRTPESIDVMSYVYGFSQQLRAKHDLPDGPDFEGLDL